MLWRKLVNTQRVRYEGFLIFYENVKAESEAKKLLYSQPLGIILFEPIDFSSKLYVLSSVLVSTNTLVLNVLWR